MLTPSEIQDKQFKSGLGYDKKDVEQYLQEVCADYTSTLKENEELKRKLKDLNDSLAYYKSIEKTLQKALILAEKTAQNTRATAFKEAEVIELEARAKAQIFLADARKQTEGYEHKMLNLIQQYDLFKIHFENLLHAQLELINSKSFSIMTDNFSYQKEDEKDEQDNLYRNLVAATEDQESNLKEQENKNQLQFDFLKEDAALNNYKTEDGFEFFTMKDE